MEKVKDETSSEIIRLYHGSKRGVHGKIRPESRKKCDFGKGFYLGTEKLQPLTLICNYPNAEFYTVDMVIRGMKVLNLKLDIDWAMFVAYNRGKMERAKGTALYERYVNFAKDYDIIKGYIANDRMFVVLDRFFAGTITDTALIESLSALKLGKQYVLLNEKACDAIKIVTRHDLTELECDRLKITSDENRKNGIALAEEICHKYRREGRYFDEILKEGE
jgi:hypothetical protein